MRVLLIFTILFWICSWSTMAQSGLCNSGVPFLKVDLTAKPSATYISPAIVRNQNCCGTSFPDRCIEFEITLHPNTGTIDFNIHSGAKPSGALYFQINCGPMTPVGQPICISGVGPHILTFCKPGSNLNEYSITTYPVNYSLQGTTAQIGCQTQLSATGFIESTITWKDVTSANQQYNSLLSCTTACAITTFKPVPGSPQFVDYQVCGMVLDTVCGTTQYVCDTLRAHVVAELKADMPSDVVYCSSAGGKWLSGAAFGGDGAYTYLWLDSVGKVLHQGNNYYVTKTGTYQLEIRDGLYPNCPAVFKTINVYMDQPAVLNAGSDTTVCAGTGAIQLNATITNASGGTWSGGGGTFSSTSDLNAIYYPSAAEKLGSVINLTLTSNADTVCSVGSVQKKITINSKVSGTIQSKVNPLCHGASNGTVSVGATGGTPPYTYAIGNGNFQTSNSFSGLAAGNYTVWIRDSQFCTDSISVSFTQPSALSFPNITHQNVSCNGGSNGSISVSISGGTTPYTYLWNTGGTAATASNLPAGIYSVTVTDAKGCKIDTSITVTAPDALTVIHSATNISCFGKSDGTISLTVSGGTPGYSYAWSHGSQSLNVSGLNKGNYSYTVTDAKGCKVQGLVSIAEPAVLSASISGKADVCKGAANGWAQVTPAGGNPPYQITWSTGATGAMVNNLAAGNYQAVIKDQNNCEIIVPFVVTAEEPIVNISLSDTVGCSPASFVYSAIISGVNPANIQWQFGDGTSSASTSGTKTYTAPGSYTISLTVNYGDGCVETVSRTVTVHASPVANAGADAAICTGESVALSGSGGVSYLWTPASFLSNDNIANPVATPSSTTTYYLKVLNQYGCAGFDTVTVTVNPLPEFSISPDTAICFGESVNLNAAGSNVYSWTPANSLSCANCTSPTATPSATTVYSVMATNAFGCTSKDSLTVTVNPLPEGLISSDTAICLNSKITLEAAGGVSYQWSPTNDMDHPNSATPVVLPLQKTTYTVLVTNSFNCSVSNNITIDILPIPQQILPQEKEICFGESASLTAGYGVSHNWFPAEFMTCTDCATTTVSPPATKDCYVEITGSNGCNVIDSIKVIVRPLPDLIAKGGGTYCKGDAIKLEAISKDSVNFLWTPSKGLNNFNIAAPTAKPDSTVVYSVTATNQYGCKNSAATAVKIIEHLAVKSIGPFDICRGETLLMKADITQGSDLGVTYTWKPSIPQQQGRPEVFVTPKESTIYTLIINSGACLPDTQLIIINVNPLPTVKVGTDRTILAGSVVELEAKSPDHIIEYHWLPEDSVECSLCPLTYAQVNQNITFHMIATDINGCKAYDQVTYKVRTTCSDMFFVPNTFTPNGDNRNDRFFVRSYGESDIRLFRIFNRWGEMVFETTDINHGWDGTHNGRTLNSDVFVWYLEGVCTMSGSITKYGNVTLLR